MSTKTETALDVLAKRHLGKFADILVPSAAQEPILAPAVRTSVFEWMAEIRASDELSSAGLKPRRSMMLYGPPGCGKTTLAHHFAARLGLPLACIRSESLIGSLLGQTGKNIGELFDAMAATEGKTVIFFDELDAIGGRRMDDQGASVERAASLNVMLRRIETFGGITIGATNRQDFIDAALWRRFDMQISVDLPGPTERFAILRRYAAPYQLPDDDLDHLVDLTDGASPALLRGLMEGAKRALILAPRINRKVENAMALLRPVIAATRPAPEFVPPPLWADDDAVTALAPLSWPWSKEK